jgi:hypothetical protein
MTITIDDFLSRPLDPLRYYDILPSDDLKVTGASGVSARALADRLLAHPFSEDAIPLIDELSVNLINQFETLAGDEAWRSLADQMAQWYAQTLRPGGSKPLGMRSQRLNFFLRNVLDVGKPSGDSTSETIDALCPWDFLRLPEEDIFLTSDADNVVRRRRDGTVSRLRCGLPTRLDQLPDGRIGIHSLYSDGAWLLDGADAHHVPHVAPILLLFVRDGRLHILDRQTRIFELESGRQLTPPLLDQAHFARMVDGRIFVIDCSAVGKIYELDLASLTLTCHEVAPVLICNDLTIADGRFYVIDKEQGSVFCFDSQFRFLGRRLAFGRAPGRLWDPVAIRYGSGQLQVLNWFGSSIVSLATF